MPVLAIITAVQDTAQTTTSATLVDASCTTAPLESGVQYLVLYQAHLRNTADGGSFMAVGEARFGTTRIGYSESQEAFNNSSNVSGMQLVGATIVTGDGSSALNMRFACDGVNTATIASQSFIAIPLTDLEAESFLGTNSDAALVTPGGASGFTDLGAGLQLTPAETGTYLVIASAEAFFGAGDSASFRFTADDVVLRDGAVWFRDSDPGDAAQTFRMMDVLDLEGGVEVDFQIEVEGVGGSTSYRRPRIVAIPLDRFSDFFFLRDTEGLTVTGAGSSGEFGAQLSIPDPSPDSPDFVLLTDFTSQVTFFQESFFLLDGSTEEPPEGFNVAVDDSGLAASDDIVVIPGQRVLSGVSAARTVQIRCTKLGGGGSNEYGQDPGATAPVDTLLLALRMETAEEASGGAAGGDGALAGSELGQAGSELQGHVWGE